MYPKISAPCMERDGLSDYDFSDDEVVGQQPRSTSKAEQLLGMLDTTNIPQPNPPCRKGWQRKLRAKASNLGFLKVAFNKQDENHLQLPTPLSGRPDSESSTSIVSPTFDGAASVSTLPSAYDSPVTPNPFFRSNSSQSSKEAIATRSHHVPHQRRPAAAAMLSTLNVPTVAREEPQPTHMPRASWHDLPFMDLPPSFPPADVPADDTLAPDPPPSTPRTRNTLQKRRGPPKPSGSPISEGTSRNQRSRRHSNASASRMEMETILDLPLGALARNVAPPLPPEPNPLSRARQPHLQPRPIPPQPPLPARAPLRIKMPRLGRHVQDWLDRADLDRTPSIGNRPIPQTADSDTLGTRRLGPRPLPPTEATPEASEASIHTLTSQPSPLRHEHLAEAARHRVDDLHWPLPPQSPASTSVVAIARMEASDLQVESVLALSSSEDEGQRVEERTQWPTTRVLSRLHHRRRSSTETSATHTTVRAGAPTPRRPSSADTGPLNSTATPPVNSEFSSKRSSLMLTDRPPVPPVPPSTRRTRVSTSSSVYSSGRAPFTTSAWQHNDLTELGSLCVAAAERGFSQSSTLTSGPPPTPRSPLALSPKSSSSRRGIRRGLIMAAPRSRASTTTTKSNPDTAPPAGPAIVGTGDEVSEPTTPGSACAFVAATGIDVTHFPFPPRSRSQTLSRHSSIHRPPPLPRNDSLPQPHYPAGADGARRQGSEGSVGGALQTPVSPGLEGGARPDWAVPTVDAPYCSHFGLGEAEAEAEAKPQVCEQTDAGKTSEEGAEDHGMKVRTRAIPRPPSPPIPIGGGGFAVENIAANDGITRKGTISNVPIFVTETEEVEDGVATFVFSDSF